MSNLPFSRLHPMAIGLLATKNSEKPPSIFVNTAHNLIENHHNGLTDKWVDDINSWCEKILDGIALGENQLCVIGGMITDVEVTVVKRRAKRWGGYPALITKDNAGWHYWMICIESFEYAVGSKVFISGHIRDIKDGMVFLQRPSKVKRNIKETDQI